MFEDSDGIIEKWWRKSVNIKQWIKKYGNYMVMPILIIITLILCYKYRSYIYLMNNPEELKEFISSFGYYGVIVFLLFQVLQVVIFFIPGEVMQVAGGWIYGTLGASVLSIIGINIASIFVFLISRKFGRPFVEKVVAKKQLDNIEKALSSKRLNLIVFLIYFLPGIPKDSSIFVCGISKISLKDFLIYSTLGRIPALVFSCYLGSSMISQNKFIIILLVSIVAIFGLIGLFKGEYLLKKIVKN